MQFRAGICVRFDTTQSTMFSWISCLLLYQVGVGRVLFSCVFSVSCLSLKMSQRMCLLGCFFPDSVGYNLWESNFFFFNILVKVKKNHEIVSSIPYSNLSRAQDGEPANHPGHPASVLTLMVKCAFLISDENSSILIPIAPSPVTGFHWSVLKYIKSTQALKYVSSLLARGRGIPSSA